MVAVGTVVECIGREECHWVKSYAMELLTLENKNDFGARYRSLLKSMAAVLLDWRWDGSRYVERYQLPTGQVVRSVGETIHAWARVEFEQRRNSKTKKLTSIPVI